ncbi:P-loop containing nucleoside triphosphate hydrolase protein [Xylona heveae TC161]|uniref:p-loop containing nucleoside triphosphate hydrolase protein n=1 Tax=Xylona heveae (strain CBS 132557 / TC161) TaxID=1328760 RepID=A0A165JP05_XYLHT|nr:P-loop containing nucleoside triphosphate hydrolase protein [Xylona heveae TC161]KZF26467.1 P-loop containing nucleoside triphosphate hydrolase protein [Xylona heveae TC161]
MFRTNLAGYFKNDNMIEMDEEFGDTYGTICEREIEILHGLAQKILEFETLLTKASDICGELDSILALAQAAKIYKLNRPLVTDQNIINIIGGRHLLQELTVSSFVPNDTFLRGGDGQRHDDEGCHCPEGDPSSNLPSNVPEQNNNASMLIMTGPNYSGKSVYLKQVALIVYMAHIGSFVPAESAAIGLTDKILSRISAKETVTKVQSAFMVDLQQAAFALSMVTRQSLIIIDEFGKGTDSSDGAGLACGIFEYLLSLGDDRPKVLAATHFYELCELGYLEPRPQLAFGHMEVHLDPEANEAEDQLAYLYK